MKRFGFVFFLIVGCFLFWGCTKSTSILEHGDFHSFHFNDQLTSLDKGRNDSLLLGTTNGKLIVFDPNSSKSRSLMVGDEHVYCSYQDSSGIFVGIRNEGLKLYPSNGISSVIEFKLAQKDHEYSVYSVEPYGDTLFCATSSGLCLLDLSNSGAKSLTPLYPEPYNDCVKEDFKIYAIKCIRDTLYAAYSEKNNTKLLVFPIIKGCVQKKPDTIFQPDKIENFYSCPAFKDNQFCMIRQDYVVMGHDSFPNTESFKIFQYCEKAEYPFLFASSERIVAAEQISPTKYKWIFQLTIPDKSYAETANMFNQNGYTYWVAGKTLYAIPDHCSKNTVIMALGQLKDKKLAVDKNNSVYTCKKQENKYKHEYKMRGMENKKVEQVEMLSNANMCVLSNGQVFLGSPKDTFKTIGFKDSCFLYEKFHRIHLKYNRLFLAYRLGFAFCDVDKNGEIIVNTLRKDSTLSVQCIYSDDTNEVLIGTLNHGCLKKQIIFGEFSNNVDTLNNYYDIIDITKVGDTYYYLAPNKLYNDSDSIDIRGLNIQRIFGISVGQQKDSMMIVGLSKTGGFYLFNPCWRDKDADVKGPFLQDICFNPYAIQVNDSIMIAGTNIGLIRININHPDSIAQDIIVRKTIVTIIGDFIKERVDSIIYTGIPAVLALFIIFAVLTVLIARLNKGKKELVGEIEKKQTFIDDLSERIKEASNDITRLNNEKQSLSESNNRFRIEIGKKQTDIDDLSERIKEANNDITRLNNEKQSLSESNNRFRIEIEKKQTFIDDLSERIKEASNDITRLNNEKQSLSESNNRFRIEIKKKQTFIDDLSERIKEASNDITRLNNEKQSLSESNNRFRIEIGKKQTDIDDLSERIKEASNDITRLNNEKQSLSESNNRFRIEIEKKQTFIDDLSERIKEASNDITRLNEEKEAKIRVLEDDRKKTIEYLKDNIFLSVNNNQHFESHAEYQKETRLILDTIDAIDLTGSDFLQKVKEVETKLASESLIKAALRLEIDNLYAIYNNHNPFKSEKYLVSFRNEISRIRSDYLEKIIGFSKQFRLNKSMNDKKQFYLDICVLCLFVYRTGKHRNVLDDKFLSDLLNPTLSEKIEKDKELQVKQNYCANLKKEIRYSIEEVKKAEKTKERKEIKKIIFKCKTDSTRSLYNEIMKAVDQELGKARRPQGYRKFKSRNTSE